MQAEVESEMDVLPGSCVPKLEACLTGVALTSPDPHALADFYENAMGYAGERNGNSWTGMLDGRALAITRGSGNRLDHAAFALADIAALAELRARLAKASVAIEDVAPAALFETAIRFHDPDGNALVMGTVRNAADRNAGNSPPARLQHVVFASDQATAMVRFYCDVVGFAPSDYVRDDVGDLTSAFLRCSAEHHSLAIFRAPRKRLDHLCYDVQDWAHIRDWADRFASHHITLRWGPGRHGPGNNLFFFVNDPDGNWLEFSSELDVVHGASPIKLWAHEERTLNSWGAAFLRS